MDHEPAMVRVRIRAIAAACRRDGGAGQEADRRHGEIVAVLPAERRFVRRIVGFGVGSLLTPVVALRFGTDAAIAAVASLSRRRVRGSGSSRTVVPGSSDLTHRSTRK